MELASARWWRPLVMAIGLVMGASGQLGDGGAPASFGDKSCPLLSALPTVSVSRVRVAIGRSASWWPRMASVALVDDVGSDGCLG